MPTKALYEAAAEFQSLSLWDELYNIDLFAVKYRDGEIGYCCVMGNGGIHYGLTVYIGNEGLRSFQRMVQVENEKGSSMLRKMTIFLQQKCLICSFEKKAELEPEDILEMESLGIRWENKKGWPLFRAHRLFKEPWFLQDPRDEERLLTALSAAILVGQRLPKKKQQIHLFANPIVSLGTKTSLGFEKEGFVPLLTETDDGFTFGELALKPNPPEADEGLDLDQITALRYKKVARRKDMNWILELVIIPSPPVGDPPSLMGALFIVDESGIVLDVHPFEIYEQERKQLIERLLSVIEEKGKPDMIHVRDDVTASLLTGVCRQIGVPLRMELGITGIDELLDDFGKAMLAPDKPASRRRATSPAGPKTRSKMPGVCAYCGQEKPKSSILKHIKSCPARKIETGTQRYYLLRVQATENPEYYLYLDVMENTTLKRLDQFLRDLWLECCGHMSAFTIYGEDYLSTAYEQGDMGMNHTLDSLVESDDTFRYTYDFGTSTELTIKVIDEFTAKKRRDKIKLMARNAPPVQVCADCGKPATQVIADSFYDPTQLFCDDCAEKSADADMLLPVVNSPRCGQCAYTGHVGDTGNAGGWEPGP